MHHARGLHKFGARARELHLAFSPRGSASVRFTCHSLMRTAAAAGTVSAVSRIADTLDFRVPDFLFVGRAQLYAADADWARGRSGVIGDAVRS